MDTVARGASSSGYETESRLTPPPIEEPDIREIFGRLWRHKVLIAGIVSVAMLSTTVILTQLTPLYTAETEILIRSSGDTLIQLSTERETPTPEDTETVKSEVEVLRSRDLAARVIDRLKLTFPVDWLHKLMGSPAFERSRSLSDNPSRQTELFLADLKVYQKGESRVIAVEFTSDNPKQAALIGNTIAELYIGDQLATKSKVIQRANTWLEKSVASLQDRVEASEKAVQDFRKASGLLEISDNTLSDQQLAELDRRLILASAEREAAQVRLNRARQVIQSASGIELAGDVLQSPLIQRLREEKMLSERRLTEFNRRYHAAHPNSEALKTQILDVKASIKAEVEAIIKNLQNELVTANEREVAVQRRLAPVKQQVAEINNKRLRLNSLEREAESNRTLLRVSLSQLKETASHINADSVKPDARVISRADVPARPSFPNYKMTLALVFVGSLCIALVLSLLLEQLEWGFRSGSQIEQTTGVPTLALIPKVRVPKNTDLANQVQQPGSLFSESIRSLYTSIHFSKLGHPPKTILVTSAEPNEGKTTIAICLARMRALGGHKVALVDTDFRKPGVHRAFNIAQRPGLAELLAQKASCEEILKRDPANKVNQGDATVVCTESLDVQRQPPKARLICLDKALDESLTRLQISLVDAEQTIGRDPENTTCIEDNTGVSRRHARILPGQSAWEIEDLKSTSGVYVNGERITRAPLKHGDIVSIGLLSFRYALEEGSPPHPGGSEFFRELLVVDGITIIPAGALPPNPPEFLASERFTEFLEVLSRHYDFVILDSPPLMAVSDARILSTKVDTTVFVVRWLRTRREVVALALRHIITAGGHLAGVALSMVDPKKHARYSYGDSGYFTDKVDSYYSARN